MRLKVVDTVLSAFKKGASVVHVAPPLEVDSPSATDGFLTPQCANVLLNTPRRQKLLTHIWQRTSLSRQQFDLLYLKPIERYAELVQQFPASESHHHAYMGGMLDHGLEIMAYALKLRQSYLLPIGSTPEDQSAQSEIWSAGIAYAALLHDIGKIAVDLHVEYEHGEVWHPWHGAVTKPYRFKYLSHREYRLHSASTGLLYHKVLDSSVLDWLNRVPELWSALLYVLAGQLEYAGVIGEIVTKADQASVAQELGGDPAKAMTAPKHALQRKLLDGLRYLLKEELKINNAGPSDGWLTDDALWLVSKTVADKLRAHLLSQGISGIPSKNSAIFDVMQEHGLLLPTMQDKAIWSATIQSTSGWSHAFTFLKVSPMLIWESGERPQSFEGTVKSDEENVVIDDTSHPIPENQESTVIESTDIAESLVKADTVDAVFDLLGLNVTENSLAEAETDNTEIEIIPPTPELKTTPLKSQRSTSHVHTLKQNTEPTDDVTPSGEHFMVWLKNAILGRKLIINDARALIHTVDDTIFVVTPGIFNRYTQEFPQTQILAKEENLPDWHWAQRQFEHLKRHRKQPDGLNIWTCIVSGPHKTRQVHGYLLAHPEEILPEIPINNPYLKLKEAGVINK